MFLMSHDRKTAFKVQDIITIHVADETHDLRAWITSDESILLSQHSTEQDAITALEELVKKLNNANIIPT